MPSYRPSNRLGACRRSSDHTVTTLPNRPAMNMWNGAKAGSGAPPRCSLRPDIRPCTNGKAALMRKLDDIDARIAGLVALRSALAAKLEDLGADCHLRPAIRRVES